MRPNYFQYTQHPGQNPKYQFNKMIKQITLIFIIALALNIVWENFHSLFYVHYRGGPITEYILFRAAFFDAAVITIFAYPFLKLTVLKNRLWIMVFALIVFSTGLEIWALHTGRWAYRGNMPVIPLIRTGLTPTIQLGLLSYLAMRISGRFTRKKE